MAVTIFDDRRLTREEYERRVRAGVFPPEARFELIDGIVYDMTPQDSPHTTCLHLALEALRSAFPSGYIRVQSPLALGSTSEPEPDLAVVPGKIGDYLHAHPTTALLAIEVSDSSLGHDRKRKIPLYARAGIPEAWILNIRRKVLEVYRDPSGGKYQTEFKLRSGDRISPLTNPGVSIPVAGFFL